MICASSVTPRSLMFDSDSLSITGALPPDSPRSLAARRPGGREPEPPGSEGAQHERKSQDARARRLCLGIVDHNQPNQWMFRLREAYHENRNLLVQMQGADQAPWPAHWTRPLAGLGWAGVDLEPRVDREIRLYIGIVGPYRFGRL